MSIRWHSHESCFQKGITTFTRRGTASDLHIPTLERKILQRLRQVSFSFDGLILACNYFVNTCKFVGAIADYVYDGNIHK